MADPLPKVTWRTALDSGLVAFDLGTLCRILEGNPQLLGWLNGDQKDALFAYLLQFRGKAAQNSATCGYIRTDDGNYEQVCCGR